MTEQEKKDFIIQALLFFATVDMSSDCSPELTEQALEIAEELSNDGLALKDGEKMFIQYDPEDILEDPYLKKRIMAILNN